MTIFLNNIKRLLRDEFTLIVMLVLPIIFISFSMFAMGGNTPMRVAVIDMDNSKLTSALKDNLKDSVSLVDLGEEEIKQKLINGKLDYAIKIQSGFTQDLINGIDVKLQTYSLKDTDISASIRFYTESFVNSAKNIASAAGGDEVEFYRGMEVYVDNLVSANYKNVENTAKDKKMNTILSLGFMVMFMLFMSSSAASLVLEDKQLKTYGRALSSPISTRSYFLQNLLSYIAIMLLQVFAIFGILKFLFRADLGPSVGSLLLLYSVYAVTSVTLGMAISSFSKDLRQDNALSYMITIPMSMLGGCFWPREIMPQFLQQLANFTPVTWVLKGTEKLLYGGSIGSIASELIILLLFALVFLILGSNRKVMVRG